MTERRFDPRRWLMLLIEPLDPTLLLILSLLLSYAFVLMVSASPERMESQMINSAVAISVMWWLRACRRSASSRLRCRSM